jgi:hypothetical protein
VCGGGNDLYDLTKWGRATNCTKGGDGIYTGGGYSRAVYNSAASSMYWLQVRDDGDLTIYRGQNAGDNQGTIWISGTDGQAIDISLGRGGPGNLLYQAKNSRYGTDVLKTGQTLLPGDFVGSANGKTSLIMQSDGNLVIGAWVMIPNSDTMADGNIGGNSATALYKLPTAGAIGNMGKVAYFDANAKMTEYPASDLDYNTNYKKFTDVDTWYNDIADTAYTGATAEKCAETCNSMESCAGFVFDNNTGKCWPKNDSMYPVGDIKMRKGYDIHVRAKTPRRTPLGAATNTTFNTDTISFQKYARDDRFADKYGLPKAISATQNNIDNTDLTLNGLAKKMADSAARYMSNTDKVTGRIDKNTTHTEKYLRELDGTVKQIQNFGPGINNIVNNSDIVVLQKNYNYLLWSIVATGIIIVSMNVVKK